MSTFPSNRVVLLGLDLSLTATAAVVVPLAWDGDWRRIAFTTVGERLRKDASDAERARRTETIATRVVAFARAHGAAVAFIESYAFSRALAAHSLGELGGVVRLELIRAGIELRTAPMATARKLLLGRIPRQDPKGAVFAALQAAGAPLDTEDLTDAMAAANFGLSELGGYCFAQSEVAA